MTRQEISAEVMANFRAWYRRNLPYFGPDREGLGYKSGRIGHRTYKRAGEMDDICAGTGADRVTWYRDAQERGIIDYQEPLQADEWRFLLRNPLVACQLALGVTDLRGLRCYRRGLSEEIARLQRKSYRRRYYKEENARRRALAAERRKIRHRRTTNPCPTPGELRAAFARRGESAAAKLRLGGMLEDLECHVDNTLVFNERLEIVGRRGGVRGWINAHAADLAPHYKTLMAYKALAKRLRQGAEIEDPLPTDAFLPDPPPAASAAPDSRAAAAGGGNFSAGDSRAVAGRGVAPVEGAADGKGFSAPDSRGAAAGGKNFSAPDSRGAERCGGSRGRRPRTMAEWRKWADWQFKGTREYARVVWQRREWSAEKVWQILDGCPNTFAELNRRVDRLLG